MCCIPAGSDEAMACDIMLALVQDVCSGNSHSKAHLHSLADVQAIEIPDFLSCRLRPCGDELD